MFTSDETEVLEILTRLPQLIVESEARSFLLPSAWGCRRRRSAIDVPPYPLHSLRFRLRLPKTPSPSPSHPAPDGGDDGVSPTSDTDSLPRDKANAPSPATPLSFSPSESDEQPVVLKKKQCRRRTKDDCLKEIEELTKTGQLILGEIDNVNRYHNDLLAYNLKLKARRDMISVGPQRENPSMNMGLQTVDASVNWSSMAEYQDPDQRHHYVKRIASQISESSQPTTSLPSTSGSGIVNKKMGPSGIPDLNVFPDESIPVDSCQPFDPTLANKHLIRFRAAQARQNRIMINRVKNKPRSFGR